VKKVIAGFISAVLLVMLSLSTFAEDNGYKVTYDGGSVANTKSGTGMRLIIDATQIRLLKDKSEVIVVPASAVTEISYGQDVHRRVVPLSGSLSSRLESVA
jgi:hypothetical protein